MGKIFTTSAWKCLMVLFLLWGCQIQDSKNGSTIDNSAQNQNFTVFGVSQGIYTKALEEGEEAKQELETLKRDMSLSKTAKRILAEAEEAKEKGDNDRYLVKIQEYRKLLNDEPIKRAAEAWILEGKVLFSQFHLQEAIQAVEEAVKLEPKNPEHLITLAEYRQWNGEYKIVEQLSLKAISLMESRDSLDKILLAKALDHLSVAYLSAGNYNSAINSLQQALEIDGEHLGEEHPEVAKVLNNLALLYQLQGKYSEAESLYQQALEIYREQFGKQHPGMATTLSNLAQLYELQGKYSEAEPIYQQALEIYREQLGQEHPDIAISLNNLAQLYYSQGKYSQAKPLFQQAWKMSRKLLGQDNLQTKMFNNSFLDVQEKLQNLEQSPK